MGRQPTNQESVCSRDGYYQNHWILDGILPCFTNLVEK
jgi:hypothetical protein